MSVIIKLSNGTQKTLDVADFSITVSELKALIAPVAEIPEDEQRIVLRGRVLKDGDVLSAIGMESGNAVHVVGCKKKVEAIPVQPSASVSTPPSVSSTAASQTPPALSNPAQSNPYAALLGSGGGLGAGFGTGAGVGAGAGGAMPSFGNMPGNTMNMEMAMQLMQNPAMRQFVQQAMQDPQFSQMLAQSNPLFANMSPETLSQTMQLFSQTMLGSGGGGGQTAVQGGEAPPAPSMGAGGMNFNPAMFAPPQPQGDPHVIYRAQLDQLREMGFPNEAANIAALQQSQGNVDFAIERLLNA